MTKYAVVIHEEPEGGFWAEVPALPGCYSQGDSIPELMDNVREAIAGVLDVLREQGRQYEPRLGTVPPDELVHGVAAATLCFG